jgi:hypothetical protein
MKSILAAVIISAIVPQKETSKTLPKSKLNSQEGIVLFEHSQGISVLKKYHNWGGPMYRVRTKNEQGKVLESFVSDKPFQKTANGWSFKVEGRNEIKEVSGNVEIGKL